MTPLINAETWLGAAGCASGSQTWSGTSPALEPAPSSARPRTSPADVGRRHVGADLAEGIEALRARQQTEAEQQGERAGARHHDIDVPGMGIAGFAVMGHHQRPRRQRHELPRHQEAEGVVGEQHEIHSGEECGEERQHPLRLMLVASVADTVKASRRGAEIDDGEKECGERIDAEIARRSMAGRAEASWNWFRRRPTRGRRRARPASPPASGRKGFAMSPASAGPRPPPQLRAAPRRTRVRRRRASAIPPTAPAVARRMPQLP